MALQKEPDVLGYVGFAFRWVVTRAVGMGKFAFRNKLEERSHPILADRRLEFRPTAGHRRS
jgi:hypothetical protein